MNEPFFELKNFSLTTTTRIASNEPSRTLLDPGTSLILPKPGVYTLEGDNQAGKSTVIKLLMGVTAVPRGRHPLLKIKGQKILLTASTSARKAGLGAVFQDDPLIPSLTVAQQFVLLHAGNKFQALWSDKNSNDDRRPKEILLAAARLLSEYSELYTSILGKYPTQLSGGALAIARIVKAQLQAGLCLLLLDEAFSGVQRDVWPLMIDKLRAWSEKHAVTILAVTHNEEEIMRWQPLTRLVINNKRIEALSKR